jgi:hypothetical protein
MRTLISIVPVLALVACAATPHATTTDSTGPAVANYDLDAHVMVPIVFAATHAQHYRVAVVEPTAETARFVMMPKAGGSPLVVHVHAQSFSSYRFATCVGACSTTIAVTSPSGADGEARELLAAIGERAQAARLDH